MSFIEMRIDTYSHGFKVSKLTPKARYLVTQFCKDLGQWQLVPSGRGKYERKQTKVFAASNALRTEYRIHRTQYEDFIKYVTFNGLSESNMEINHRPTPEGADVDHVLVDTRTPHDYQEGLISYILSPGGTKVITLQTGQGKTGVSNWAVHRMGKRGVVVVKGMYVQRWIDDLKKTFGFKQHELLVVRGSKELKNLILLMQEGQINPKFIIITNTTMRNYIAEYERYGPSFEYGCEPDRFYETVGAGVRVIDEAHQDFHLNFKMDLYTNVAKTITMTATLVCDDPFIDRMYGIAYPHETRMTGKDYHKYINVKAISYRFDNVKQIRTTQRGSKSYSHVAFEESIMRQPHVLKRYMAMITDLVRMNFIEVREPQQKCLVFAATVQFCTILSKHLAKEFYHVKVGRYVSEDDYEVLDQNDITVSTLQSSGTAVDIYGLRVVIMTPALSSSQANLQAMGRLRELKDWPDTLPEFYYLMARDIPKHVEYHHKKLGTFEGKALSHKSYETGYVI